MLCQGSKKSGAGARAAAAFAHSRALQWTSVEHGLGAVFYSIFSPFLYHEPHSADAVFGPRQRRTSLMQIFSQISASTFELIEPVLSKRGKPARDGTSS
ncbi:hypothetical protein EVAR_33646_1 [Eumeta japonica]|uniref:Uncharacterized protein n=1 Tax=Eumeta variegata TaxID=151549 RepID=A0A4C1VMZ8_EUMVA|nr:hypothetical protein EVAR_33646_1 [Eumeta japonica]